MKSICMTCYGLDDESCDCEDCNGLGYTDDNMALNDQVKIQEEENE